MWSQSLQSSQRASQKVNKKTRRKDCKLFPPTSLWLLGVGWKRTVLKSKHGASAAWGLWRQLPEVRGNPLVSGHWLQTSHVANCPMPKSCLDFRMATCTLVLGWRKEVWNFAIWIYFLQPSARVFPTSVCIKGIPMLGWRKQQQYWITKIQTSFLQPSTRIPFCGWGSKKLWHWAGVKKFGTRRSDLLFSSPVLESHTQRGTAFPHSAGCSFAVYT